MSTPLFDSLFPDPPLPTHVPLTPSELRDSGMESVLSHTAEEWKEKLRNRVKGFLRGYTFTMDTVVDDLGGRPSDVHQNSIGALTFGLARAGLIERTGRTLKAERAARHRADMPEWRRL